MARRYTYPKGPFVKKDGVPTASGQGYLIAIENLSNDINEVANLDSGTSYTNDQLRDKLIAVITALQG